ncbi:MAG: class E sortase [Aeriscardovia sp.]|nr:class E sortase [Aeriscardovia sp.]
MIGEILLTLAALCILYAIWQIGWTGIISERTQTNEFDTVSWETPGTGGDGYKIASPQSGTPPILPNLKTPGAILGEIYIPCFGSQYKRLIVQGTSLVQLDRHGLGHYESTPMFGAVGNVGLAGHREGYGAPLGDVAQFKTGDEIIIRTTQYWYVYAYQSYQIVLPSQTQVIDPVPNQPGATPTERLMTLTTCTPRYGIPTHRWIVYAKFKYWAYVKDGIPAALAQEGSGGKITFPASFNSWTASIPPVSTIFYFLLAAWLIVFAAAAITWRWPSARKNMEGKVINKPYSIYSALRWVNPGVKAVRWVLLVLGLLCFIALLFAWVFPWMASTIPILKSSSNYVAIPQ